MPEKKSLTIVLPKVFSETLQIGKGDFLKVHIGDKTLVLEKAEV
jgi:bifunctional DNA-binding transcriptional regulator/antitoxin component of YhaV-PrlF toxin-antitoxin module